jgi:hypothetical protein
MSKTVLLVEGRQDLRVIPELIEKNGVPWVKGDPHIPHIHVCDGDSKLLAQITIWLKETSLSALGIVVDADDNPRGRWESIRNVCRKVIPDLPEELPESGLICNASNEVKFGVWIMPDNRMESMLETFLAYLIPDERETLWEFAQQSTQEATNQGADFTEFQRDKANIYTWLAWQNPPGRQLHQAVMAKILNPTHPNAQKFVTWFKELYGL